MSHWCEAGWDEHASDSGLLDHELGAGGLPRVGPGPGRAKVEKTFTGDLEGTSTAELLLCGGGDDPDGGAGYLAHELVSGRLAGRVGTFVIQHGGLAGGGGEPVSFGAVVPGTGTGELEGLTGEARFQHDEHGVVLTIDYDLPPG